MMDLSRAIIQCLELQEEAEFCRQRYEVAHKNASEKAQQLKNKVVAAGLLTEFYEILEGQMHRVSVGHDSTTLISGYRVKAEVIIPASQAKSISISEDKS